MALQALWTQTLLTSTFFVVRGLALTGPGLVFQSQEGRLVTSALISQLGHLARFSETFLYIVSKVHTGMEG